MESSLAAYVGLNWGCSLPSSFPADTPTSSAAPLPLRLLRAAGARAGELAWLEMTAAFSSGVAVASFSSAYGQFSAGPSLRECAGTCSPQAAWFGATAALSPMHHGYRTALQGLEGDA